MCVVTEHEESKKSAYSLFEINKNVRRVFNLNFENTVSQENFPPITAARKTKHMVKKTFMKEIQNKYTNKPMHGQYAQALESEQIDKKKSIAWLRSAGLKETTESLIIAAQDQTLATNYYGNKILKKALIPIVGFAELTLKQYHTLFQGVQCWQSTST